MGVFDFVKDAGEKIFGREDAKPAPEAPVNHARQAYLRAQAEKAERQAEEQAERSEEYARSMALVAMIQEYGFDVSRLDLQFDDAVVTMTGAVDTQQELEVIVLLVGNTEGVEKVDAQVEVLNPSPEATLYTVEKGDTLSGISKHFYGSSSHYRKIFEANRPMLTDADKIYPGQVLRIPVENENVA